MFYCEDVMVGYHLNKNNIFPSSSNLYTDDINQINAFSYHNYTHTVYYLYIRLTGGLGNQLFQIGCAMDLAIKYNKCFVINTNLILQNTHQNSVDEIIKILLLLFPYIKIDYNVIDVSKAVIYRESKNHSYFYNKTVECIVKNNNKNIILYGNFINFNYLSENIMKKCIYLEKKEFPFYFIHIRLGDYLKNEHKILHFMDLTNYFIDCINKIKSYDNQAEFIICTNERSDFFYKYISKFPKNTKYTIQEESDDCLKTLTIMSSCKGGICSNSTLSYMGSYFQEKGLIFFPYPHLNLIDGFNEDNININDYPNWCKIIKIK
jgi:hypothetical protein